MMTILNHIIKWFFCRLIRKDVKTMENYRILSYDMMPDGSISSRGQGKWKTTKYLEFHFPVSPLTHDDDLGDKNIVKKCHIK